jgi:transcription elongation GreA/GreB family factor
MELWNFLNSHSCVKEIGTTVKVIKEGSKDSVVYSIVGAEEADMTQNKISNKSALGEALFGKSKQMIKRAAQTGR